MRKIYFILFIFQFLFFQSQTKITVTNPDNGKPIANAKISCQKNTIGKTNSNGFLEFKTKCKSVTITANGFYEDDALVEKEMNIYLTKTDDKMSNIATVILEDKSDPKALELLKKINHYYKQNSPQSLPSYSFKSYEKIGFDLDEDSVANYNKYLANRTDSLKKNPSKPVEKSKEKDSIESANVMNLMGESKLFLWEKASEFLYSQKYGEKVNILDNRVSGLNKPIYEMMTLRSNRNQIPKEIKEENRSLYRFFLTDSIEIDGRQNYVIKFRQVDGKTPPNRRKFNGFIYVDAETFGIKKIESTSRKRSEGTLSSEWKPIDNKWFLVKERLNIRMGSTNFMNSDSKDDKDSKEKSKTKFGNYVSMKTDYFDFKTPIEENAKDFRGYSMTVKNSDGSLLSKYRTEELNARELATYEKIDSVGNKYKLDQKINAFTGLMKGKIRSGIFDFDIAKFIAYNKYEKLRLGAGVKLNERFNKYISPDAYIAFGLGDGSWKYGIGVDFKTSTEKNSYFRVEYFDDVMAAGKFNENEWNFRMKLMNTGVQLNNDRFYHYKGFKASFENDITNGITVNLAAKRTTDESTFAYDYKGLGSEFDVFSTTVTLKFSPKSKNIMTPSGKFTYHQALPELYLNYEQGWDGLGGELNFSRIDALFVHQFKTKLGVTGFRLFGGFSTGESPIWYNFSMNGLGNGKDGLNFNISSYLGFATMKGGLYYNDKFAGTYFTHRIPWYFKTFGKNTSSFDVIYRGAIGDMKNPEYHDFDFKKLDHLYNEAGLEWNNFLSTGFNLGFFYRVGHYQTSNFKDNFAVQLKFKVLGF